MTLLGLAFFLITAFTVGRMSLLFSVFPAHEFEEATLLTACCRVLIEESQILFIELGKELIPCNLFKGILAAITREVDAQNAYFVIAFSSFDGCRLASTGFGPFPDFIVVCCRSRFSSHETPPYYCFLLLKRYFAARKQFDHALVE